MSSHDIVRVFKGVGLVVDQLVVLNKSGLREKVSRAQFHASELMKVAFEIRSDMANNDNNKPSENDHNSNTTSHTSHSAPTSHNSHSSPSSPVPPTPFVSTPIPSTPFVSPITSPLPPLPSTVSVPTAPTVTVPAVSMASHGTSNISIPISIQDFAKPVDIKHSEMKEKTEDLIGFDPAVKNAEKKNTTTGDCSYD